MTSTTIKKNRAKLSTSEQTLLQEYERGALRSVASDAEVAKVRTAARSATIKDQRINIRLTKTDLQEIQAIAVAEGLPYQSLIASILHKYVTGRLVDRGTTSRGRRR